MTRQRTTKMRRAGWSALAAAALMVGPALTGLTVASAVPAGPPTCDTSSIAQRLLTGGSGVAIPPSVFGLAPGGFTANASADVSGRFGYPANSGAVIVEVWDAYRHPHGPDVFISGNNPDTRQGGGPFPTRMEFTGSVSVILDYRPDSQWFDDDTKQVWTNDGTELTYLQLLPEPPAPLPPGFTPPTTPSGGSADEHELIGPKNLAPGEIVSVFTAYLSEIEYVGGQPVGFATTTTDFTFNSLLVNDGLWPVANVYLFAACPTGADDVTTTPLNTAVDINVLANDPTKGMSLLSFNQPLPSAGTTTGTTAEGPNGTITYTPPAGWSGTTTFTYTAFDPVTQQTVTQTVTVTVLPVGADDVATTPLNTPVVIPVLDNDPAKNLTVKSVTDPPNGTAVVNPDGTVTYTPNTGWSGTDTFTYTAVNPDGVPVTQWVTVTVPPGGADDVATTPLNTPVVIPVLDNDPAKNLTVQSVTEPSNGTAVVNPDGTVTYTPNTGWSGTDTFTYTAVNPDGVPVTQTVTVTVKPVGKDDSATTPSGTPVVIPVLANDPTKDLTVGSVTQPSNGVAVLNPDGTVTYTPKTGFSGTDTFTYTATDPSGQPITQTVTVVVSPVGKDDSATTQPGTPVKIPVLDSDPTKGLTVTSVTQPSSGTAVINPDGSVTYTPNKGFSGTDTFTYTATDSSGQSVVQIVTVTVGKSGVTPTKPGSGAHLPNTGSSGTPTTLALGGAAIALGAAALLLRRRRGLSN